MKYTTMTSREFNQDTARAKRVAEEGPVYITDRGRPAHVLLSIAEFERLAGRSPSLAEALAGDGDFAFEAPRLNKPLTRPLDLG